MTSLDDQKEQEARKPPAPEGSFSEMVSRSRNELKFAYHIADRHEGRLVHDGSKWLSWAGTHWERDDKAGNAAIREVIAEEIKAGGGELSELAAKFSSRAKIKALAGTCEDLLHVDPDLFDNVPHQLATPSGVYDFRTKGLIETRPEAYISCLARGSYIPDHQYSNTFKKFITTTLPDSGVRDYVQRLFGLVLNGDHHEEIAPFLCGTGGSGKSRLMDLATYALGADYSHTLDNALFMKRQQVSHKTVFASLEGLRLAMSTELGEGILWDDGVLKVLTGGDPINARKMYQDDRSFLPTHTLMVITNHMPQLPLDDSGALLRRVRVIPFTSLESRGVKVDKSMQQKLMTEETATDFITWAIRGWEKYAEQGDLPMPDAIKQATDQYWHNQDTLAQWLASDRVILDPNMHKAQLSTPTDLHKDYERFCADHAARALGLHQFVKQMEKRGHQRVSRRTGGRGITGIALAVDDL
ncbi:DNA primase family protein [Tsukamurella strandjordii]|uniref:Phage/plasmid primase, P4 family n=1 Tax=Tsukamurella strandjordii TaxID=147577 RepID=A0AA90NB73_9ACTN|nr:phage/plasmid primase, P4 family [Tsukamurella strandjordii]MDP0398538.1 phage/plasmid primase, P4 family [Tsukamurella strandjordii]